MLEGITPESVMREITDEEVDFYRENGWVFLKRLVDPDFCEHLRKVGRDWLTSHNKPEIGSTEHAFDVYRFSMEDRPDVFRSVSFTEIAARNAQRLMNRKLFSDTDVPVRFGRDAIVFKGLGKERVKFHQDSAEHAPDRVGEFMFWLALDEATPEMGTMQFLSGVHREGPLGSAIHVKDLLEYYPKLTDLYELTPPFHYEAGDATAHHGLTIHGSAPNRSDRIRSSYVFAYTPADAAYWEGKSGANEGSKRVHPDNPESPIIVQQ